MNLDYLLLFICADILPKSVTAENVLNKVYIFLGFFQTILHQTWFRTLPKKPVVTGSSRLLRFVN